MKPNFPNLLLGIVALACGFGPAMAQSPDDAMISVELRDGWQTDHGTRMAALHLTLTPGWKTYWRAPGEGGFPPSFDWRGSKNLGAIGYHWPRPEMFETGGLRYFGYRDELVLPIEIRPADPTQEVDLTARVEMGVCQEICVPTTLDLALHFDPRNAGQHDSTIAAALKRQPETAAQAGVTKAVCQVEPVRDGMKLTVSLTMPPLGGAEIGVVELTDRPVWVAGGDTWRDGGMLHSSAEMVPETAQPFAVNRSAVRITVFGGDDRVVDIQGCSG